MKNLIIPDEELKKYGTTATFSGKALALLNQQKMEWELCAKNYSGLKTIKSKIFKFNNIEIKLQFNPGRIKSTSAKVDKESIKKRKCFLCIENLPAGQRGIKFNDDYTLLCNPFPIFDEHYTIINEKHTPQQIKGNFPVFLSLVRELGDKFTVFYNGPQCGASAPDHMHFQAGTKNVMPVENEYEKLKRKNGVVIYQSGLTLFYAVNDGLRKMFFLEGTESSALNEIFDEFYTKLADLTTAKGEPMMNITGFYNENIWKIVIYPREKHRPSFYYLEDAERLTVSPAAVDMSGLVIVPREEDFEKLNVEIIKQIYNEVTINDTGFNRLRNSVW